MATTIPALAYLKDGRGVERSVLPGLLTQAFADKLIPPHVVMDLLQQIPGPFARLLALFWMRETDGLIPGLHEALMQSLWIPTLPHYQGTSVENTSIDERICTTSHARRALVGRGSCFTLQLDQWCQIPAHTPLLQTPVLILGAGPSGLLTARALFDLGFRRITVLDEQGSYGGIWNSPQVQLTRTNPFALRYRGPRFSASVPPAPGSGKAMSAFFHRLVEGSGGEDDLLPAVVQAQVRGVIAGDLSHAVLLRDPSWGERIVQSPLLINALGVGVPRPLSARHSMQTDAEEQAVDQRWQEALREEDLAQWQGQRLVFVGLSASTLTMVQQAQHAIDRGYDLSYTVLTHHDPASLLDPVASGLARDVRRGDLDGLALDLPAVREAFRRLCGSQSQREQMLPQVAHWSIRQEGDGNRSLMATSKQDQVLVLPALARVYGLLGYEQPIHTLNACGIGVIEGRALVDVDGEVQAAHERHVHRGYFALGPVALGHPNANSLPGILYRVGELLPTLIARAAEYTTIARS
ncbi:hypothetical protein KSF_087110 [Reticulibacter mediterranei]|uniref:Uncharacterized protein n=1 Tax=Reticulibacter mediterranei TaxID=2778369 RepID=A0A8J3N7J1_9CHLR|nr:NAD(P)-binding protein [Reticulibacter mediterranei]GHO98663.1 hypothetical protein KSF_087110 [Reticulibacter mediterranei]